MICCIPRKGWQLHKLRSECAGDGPEWNALQPEAGIFDERVFASLDWVIAQAKARGIRLCMPLVNYWPAYGGIPQYIRCRPRLLPICTPDQNGVSGCNVRKHCSIQHLIPCNGSWPDMATSCVMPVNSCTARALKNPPAGGAASGEVWMSQASQRPSMRTAAVRTSSKIFSPPSLRESTPSLALPTGAVCTSLNQS